MVSRSVQLGRHLGQHHFSQLADGEFAEVANINWARIHAIHHPDQALNQIVHNAETRDLSCATLKQPWIAVKRLSDEIIQCRGEIRQHGWNINIKNSYLTDLDNVYAVMMDTQRICYAYSFLLAGSTANRV